MASQKVDFFSYQFESLKSIFYKYGNSEEYDTAVLLIDAVIAHIVKTYGDSYATTILYFPDTYSLPPVQSVVEALLKDHVLVIPGTMPLTSLYYYYPQVYLSPEALKKEQELCTKVRQAFSEIDISVICNDYSINTQKRAHLQTPEPSPAPQPSSVPAPAPQNNTPSPMPTPSPAPAPNYAADKNAVEMVHIVLWTCLFFIAAGLMSCYHLAVIESSNEPEFKARSFEMGGGRSQTQKVQ